MESKPPVTPKTDAASAAPAPAADAKTIRQAYTPPKLTYLGTVRELTLGSPSGTFLDPGHSPRASR